MGTSRPICPAVFDWPPRDKWALAEKYYFAPEFMATRMSALGHKRTFCDAGAMSALPPNVLQNYFEDQNEQY
jgi:hypothetical protein